MTYVTSNIFGDYSKLLRLMDEIDLKSGDTLHILGNLVDFGEDSMRVVTDMSMRYNVYPVLGEHDRIALDMLTEFDKLARSGKKPGTKYIGEMKKWAEIGGRSTLEGFMALDDDMKEGALEYFSDMPAYDEISIDGVDYVFVSHWIGNYPDEDADPDSYFDRSADFSVRPLKDKIVVTGYNPDYAEGDKDAKIYHGDGVIGLDCGAGRDGRLSCLRIEDGKEFYI